MNKFFTFLLFIIAVILILTGITKKQSASLPLPITIDPKKEFLSVADFHQETLWSADSPASCHICSHPEKRNRTILEVQAPEKGDILIRKKMPADWKKWDTLIVEILLPSNEPKGSQVFLSLKDSENFWYQSATPCLLNDKTNTIRLDLSGETEDIVPSGHYRPWNRYTAGSIREITITVLGKTKRARKVQIADIRLERKKSVSSPPTQLTGLRILSPQVKRYEKFEAAFLLSTIYLNPFDPDEVNIRAQFTSPSGKKFEVPAFFFQDYQRRFFQGREELIPYGAPCWKVRFSPTETGTYTWRIVVRDQSTLITPQYTFRSLPSSSKGFIRIAKDQQYFAFDDGTLFYPLGLNIVSPWDTPYGQEYLPYLPKEEGTFAFDRYLENLGKNRANFIRMWMANWWLAMEWKEGEGPFEGIGRYSLQNAWKMDHIINTAEKNGIRIQLTINNHTQLAGMNWPQNPYNTANGGFLKSPGEFFTHKETKVLFQKKMRYIVSRWGYSPHLFSWDFWSEVDLTSGYNPSIVKIWHQEMASFVKSLDPWKHLVATHYCYHSRAGTVAELKEIDFSHSNAWVLTDGLPDSQIDAIHHYYHAMKRFGKPIFISEYGGHWAGSPNDIMIRDLHTGLWANAMYPLAAGPLFWWWNLLDEEELYWEYKALANFFAGEERIGKNLLPKQCRVISAQQLLDAKVLGNRNTAYAWIYDFREALRLPSETETITNGVIEIPSMEHGEYRVEFWDTRKGIKTGHTRCTSIQEKVIIPLPPIEKDIACKIRFVGS
ncbi:MAG: DUF5060 domain-containing protein [Candidatus Ratteibacteria bacterium]